MLVLAAQPLLLVLQPVELMPVPQQVPLQYVLVLLTPLDVQLPLLAHLPELLMLLVELQSALLVVELQSVQHTLPLHLQPLDLLPVEPLFDTRRFVRPAPRQPQRLL